MTTSNTSKLETFLIRAFPIFTKYLGLAIAAYEAFLDRPPQALVIGLAASLIAGARVVENKVGG